MDIQTFLQIGIVGAALSGFVQLIKEKYGTQGFGTKIITVVLALLFSTAFVFLKDTAFWPTIITILGTASTIYALVIK